MGKRKERRMAATKNAGRRVKLDLFAEPLGDLGGSDGHDKMEQEQSNPNESPHSPSSSGTKTQNPLLLLGQYSDDELEDSAERVDDTVADNNEQDVGAPHGEHDTSMKSGGDTVTEMVDQQQTEVDAYEADAIVEQEGGEVAVCDDTASVGLHKKVDSPMQASAMVSSELHSNGDGSSQWKMVLHEESNKYYYWNVETGETSWEVPQVLTQTAEVAAYYQYIEPGPVDTYGSHLAPGVEASQSQPVHNVISEPDSLASQKTVDVTGCQTEVLNESYKGEDGNESECRRTSTVDSLPIQEDVGGSGNSSEYELARSDNGVATDFPARLLEQGERLLEKLRSLERSDGNLCSHERISKYICEVEVRLSDVKALISDASSLLLFWSHTEKQLNRLENSINNEIYELAKSAVMDGNSLEKDKSDDMIGSEVEDSGREEGEINHCGPASQEVDMDVDMEVEAEEPFPTSAVPASEPSVPPPPAEEWVQPQPPPPPENEEVPPPPPPDTDAELMPPPPQSYLSQYNLSYPGPSYDEAAAHASLNCQFYGIVDGSQVALPQSSFYCGTIVGTSGESAVTAANPYLNYNEGAVMAPLFPVVSSSAVSSLHHPSSSSQSTDAGSGASSTVSTKGQSKVTRPKKRTVAVASTLRSNKKVSSLVDKWKAAKEELNESEEEENKSSYEILERKRQRELEEWKARHIASGEAKDNANFQPLGGDWREKVKRKREQAASEAKKKAEKEESQQRPDLTKTSADLPSGWQAYWDESTKQVYYGNTITSQTSWTKPTR